jgi:hypothetical protein
MKKSTTGGIVGRGVMLVTLAVYMTVAVVRKVGVLVVKAGGGDQLEKGGCKGEAQGLLLLFVWG